MDLASLLSEYDSCASDPLELRTFYSSLTSNPDTQSALLSALNVDKIDPKMLTSTLTLLLGFYRHLSDSEKHVCLQFLPNLIAISLIRERNFRKEVDPFLLSIYNCEVDRGHGWRSGSFRMEGLAQGSIYHDGSRITDALEANSA